jgi:5-methylcytosine-specific restriction endonuclease McrA
MEVLVLSSCYEPIRRVPWPEAFGYVVAGRAEVVETYVGREVRSASRAWPLPSIVRFVRRTARLFRCDVVKFNRRMVYVRDKGCCQYCGRLLPMRDFTLDHVVPRCRGGETSWVNVVVCCGPCNRRKADRRPAQAGMRLLSEPRRPRSVGGGVPLWSPAMPEAWRIYLKG